MLELNKSFLGMKDQNMKRDLFKINIDQLQPSQPFLSQGRLDNIARNTDFLLRPVAVRELNGRYCIIEGHERCYALVSLGYKEVEAYIDDSENDRYVWQECVKLTTEAGIANVMDLENSVLPIALFREKWVQRKRKLNEKAAGNLSVGSIDD